MKIACICNINHAQFILARYLRDMGHEVTLFLMEEYPHFYPENDCYGPIEDIEVVELPWKHKELYKVRKREILEKLGGFDIYCGSEFAPAFLYKAGLPLHIFIPIGTDLTDYPFERPVKAIPETWAIDEYQFNLYQKAGIRHAGALFMNEGGDMTLESALKKLGFEGKRFPLSLPYLYLPGYLNENAVSTLTEKIANLRQTNRFLFISHGRCEFTDPGSIHYKGTEIMLRGLSEMYRRGKKDWTLVMLEYGNDVDAAKNLIAELELDDHIIWLPTSGRKEIFPVLKYFDAGFGTLSYPHWSYNVAMELLAAGVPVIRRGKLSAEKGCVEYPGICFEQMEQFEGVLELIFEKDSLRQAGIGGQQWFRNRTENALEMLKKYLGEATNKTHRPGYLPAITWGIYNYILRLISKIRWKMTGLSVHPS